MDMKRCPNGHYYDPSLYQDCPYCRGASANVNLGVPPQPQPGATMPVRPMDRMTPPPAPGPAPSPAPAPSFGDAQKTVAVIQQKTGINPVVGWMVCVDGLDKGKDFRLQDGNNFIGRSRKMDICLESDEAVSRENQGVISYDSRHKAFYAAPGTGQNLMYLNGEPLMMIHELKPYDRLELGSTTLMFMPLCGEEFQWEKE